LVKAAILAVIGKNPKRPAELRGIAPEKLRHDQDITNMEWLMSKIHLPTLDEHINELPQKITSRALWFWEGFRVVVASSLFNLHDPVLCGAVNKLLHGWQTALDHDEQYDSKLGTFYVFTNPLDLPLPPKRKKIWDEIDKARFDMADALVTILKRLRESYVEIDIHKTNRQAWNEYVEFQTQLGKSTGLKQVKRPAKKKKAINQRS
jgi:hypothetical protein